MKFEKRGDRHRHTPVPERNLFHRGQKIKRVLLTNIHDAFAVSTEVDGSRQYVHVGQIIDDLALDVAADVVDEESLPAIVHFDE